MSFSDGKNEINLFQNTSMYTGVGRKMESDKDFFA
jgi:hypothetical protein